uniref:Uncharacterized protein n=1 Tax=Strix occidentalis caurina TaxID=311401 RepID=A0A8D0EX86_STROC
MAGPHHPQCLREAIAEHRPLVGKLQRVSAQLAELSPEQGAPFQRRWREAEERYGRIRDHARQLTERMDLLLECLERLQGRLQSRPSVRGDATHLRELIRENSLALANSDALQSQWSCLRGRCQEQECWLRELLALAERFWHGLSELALTLSDTQQLVLGLEEGGGEPEAALREEIDSLQGELDALGSLGVELMSSCGDPDKPDVTKSLDDVSAGGWGPSEGQRPGERDWGGAGPQGRGRSDP